MSQGKKGRNRVEGREGEERKMRNLVRRTGRPGDPGISVVLRNDRAKESKHRVNNTGIVRPKFEQLNFKWCLSMVDRRGRGSGKEPGSVAGGKLALVVGDRNIVHLKLINESLCKSHALIIFKKGDCRTGTQEWVS